MARTYKDSGIPWIGEIPQEWEIGKVKNYYSFQTGFTPDTKNELYYDDNGALWVNISDIGDDHYIKNTKKRISANYITKFNPNIVPKGSLLYSFKLSVGAVAIAGENLYTNEAIAAFLPTEGVNLSFLYYSSQVCIIYNAIENIYGAKLLNQDLINNATIIYPPLSEQQRIAEFLDRKCEEIDELIGLQGDFIEELKAYKQSLITETVTRGLNPNAKLKPSGIDWIGEIPETWEICRLKDLVKKRNQKADDASLQYIGLEHLVGFPEEMVDTENVYDKDGSNMCFPDDVIFGKLRPYLGKVKVIHEQCCCSAEFLVLHDASVPSFIRYLMLSDWFMEIVNSSTYGAKMPRANATFILNMIVCSPSIKEQQQIADYLDKKCSEIDNLIAIKQQKIEELKDYKKSIIYEYVTGKKDANG